MSAERDQKIQQITMEIMMFLAMKDISIRDASQALNKVNSVMRFLPQDCKCDKLANVAKAIDQ